MLFNQVFGVKILLFFGICRNLNQHGSDNGRCFCYNPLSNAVLRLYLNGWGVRKIKRYFEENEIKTVTGKDVWSASTIDRILSNEKYIGDVLMQKSYTEDFLTGKRKKNKDELDMYFIENDHESIISRDVFEAVQERKVKNKVKYVQR